MARFSNGWVKIYRKAILGDIGANYTRGGLFMTLVGIANIQESTVSWKGKPKTLTKGEIVTSISELADLGECDRRTVDRHLHYLVLRGTITLEKSSTGALIKITNFEKYQSHDEAQVKPSRNDTQNDTSNDVAHIEELKNIRREEEGAEVIFKIWNEYRNTLPEALKLSLKRKAKADQRWSELPSEEAWVEVVQRIAHSDFCNGANDRGWKADFDFLLQPDTHIKANEGKYDNKKGAAKTMGVIGA